MSFRTGIPSPMCPPLLTDGQKVCENDWKAVADSLNALHSHGKVIFEARHHVINSALYLPLSGYNANTPSTVKQKFEVIELLPGYTHAVVILDLKLLQTIGTPNRYQTAEVIISSGAAFQTLATYTSNPADPANIGFLEQSKAEFVGLNAAIIPQPGYTTLGAITLKLTTINSPNIPTGMNITGIFGCQVKLIHPC